MKRRPPSAAAQIRDAVNTALSADVIGLASDSRFKVEKITTGSLTIDRITGGGLPRGRHVELSGDYAAGKSTIAYRTMALAQQRGELCALADPEKVFEADWFRQQGGDPENLLMMRPDEGQHAAEHLIEVLMLFARGGEGLPKVSIVTIDSVASLLPGEELKKQPTEGEDRTASRARMMSRLLRRVTTVNQDTLFIWTNQTIDKVSGYGGTTTPGGRALKFYASVRLELKKLDRKKAERNIVVKGKMTKKEVPVGQWVAVRAEKQKTARPEMEGTFLFDFDRKCIDREREILFLGLQDGLIDRRGNVYHFEDSDGQAWSGMETAFVNLLRDTPEMADEIAWAINANTMMMGGDENGS
jgi:recombination protein RecA